VRYVEGQAGLLLAKWSHISVVTTLWLKKLSPIFSDEFEQAS